MSDGRLKDERRHPGQGDKDLGKGGVTHRPGLPTSFSPLSADRKSLKRSSGRSTKLDLTGTRQDKGSEVRAGGEETGRFTLWVASPCY